jgi:hypothetical protein
MKKLVLVAALATLSACQQEAAPAPEATPDTAAATAATAAPAGSMAADGKSPIGKFQITTHDGKVFTEEVKADGSYVQTDAAGKVVETGKWEQKSPTQYCFTTNEKDAKQVCNTEGVDAAGKWTTTNAKGETATVVRVEA